MQEGIKGKGVFNVTIFDKQGNKIQSISENNLIVDLGRNNISHFLGNDTIANKYLKQIGFGENSTAAAPSDSGLSLSAIFKNFDSITFPDTGTVSFNWSLDYSEGNGLNLTEFGLFNNVPVMFSRYVRNVIAKSIDIRLVGQWILIF